MSQPQTLKFDRQPRPLPTAAWQGHKAGTAIKGTFDRLRQYRQRWLFRNELRRLLKAGDHLVTDIGYDRQTAQAESIKPFWQD